MTNSFVSFDPAMRSGEATINHTRLSADAVGGYVWSGDAVDLVAETYEITRADVIVACWWLGAHGSRAWRKRWGAWAKQVHGELWHERYDVVDPPPGRAS